MENPDCVVQRSASYVLSHFSRVWLCETLWIVACQSPLSMGLSRQEHWSGLPCPSPGDLPDSGIKHESLKTPALGSGLFTTSTTWEAPRSSVYFPPNKICTFLNSYLSFLCILFFLFIFLYDQILPGHLVLQGIAHMSFLLGSLSWLIEHFLFLNSSMRFPTCLF